MKKLTETPFDLIPVTIAGNKLHPRPVDFEYDEKTGEASAAIKYHSTCPKCSQLIEFTPSDVHQRGNDSSDNPELFVSGCRECPLPKGCIPALSSYVVGVDYAHDPAPTYQVDLANLELLGKPIEANGEAFNDPIAGGVMALPNAERVDV